MSSRTRFYLDKRNAKFMGVCAGAADYFGVDPLWVRVGTVLVSLLGGAGITIPAYLVIGWLAENKPRALYDLPEAEQKFWREMRTSPTQGLRDVRGSFRDLDRRLRDIETHVTSSSRNLSAEIDRLR